jgi:hypothetical protein
VTQNRKRNPNWTFCSLPPIPEMICPNCGLVTSVTGGANAG